MKKGQRRMPDRKEMRPVEKAFIQAVMFQLGIVPMEGADLDMRRPLKELSPEEQRKIKRKFRKVWRKLMREQEETGRKASVESMKRGLGVGKRVPSRAERTNRKKLVLQRVWDEAITPMLERFENPDEQKKSE